MNEYKYYIVRYRRKDLSSSLYIYKSEEEYEEGDLVFVKNRMNITIVEIVQETMPEYRRNDIYEEGTQYREIVEKVKIKDGNIYFQGGKATQVFLERYSRYDKSKTFFNRIVGYFK